ncbi:MAG: hypothetical protein ABI651_18455 [Verrucomicrobiota bacterium]
MSPQSNSQNILIAKQVSVVRGASKKHFPLSDKIFLSLLTALLGVSTTAPGADVIYVAEEQLQRVSIVQPNGAIQPFANDVGLVYGLALDSVGNLYVAGTWDDTIRKVTPAGAISVYASSSTLGSPAGLAFDGAGNLFTAGFGFGGTVNRISPNGTVDRVTTGIGGQGLAFDASGNLYVASSDSVIKITPSGAASTFASGFNLAWGIAFDRNGNLFVADAFGDSVSKVTPSGVVSLFATGLDYPTGLAFDSSGNLYICNITHTEPLGYVSRITLAGVLSRFATGFNYPTAIAILAGGSSCNTVVTSTASIGPGSLRAAIECANANPGLDTISFNIPGAGPHTISLTDALPIITDSIIIDGTTQPGFAGMPIIELDGTRTPPTVDGLTISGFTAANSIVRGLVINRFTGSGIEVDSADYCQIEGNFIGTDLSGTVALGNAQFPPNGGVVLFDSDHCIIGGTILSARNVISGNSGFGVSILSGSDVNIVQGNFIGTDLTGTLALGVAPGGFIQVGVLIEDSSYNLVGGTTVGARNVISGNVFGLNIFNTFNTVATGNLVQGNFIGTDKEGVRAVGNLVGVDLDHTSGNTIGGTIAGARNIISGNDLLGISLATDATGTLVQGNYIGTDVTGTRKLGNGSSSPATLGLGGILIDGAFNNTIGGDTPEARNVISGNDTDGIQVFGLFGTTGNRIEGNFIGTDKDGLADLGNARHGVLITDKNGIPSNNTIGGTSQAVGNIIAFNGGDGVAIGSGNGAPIRGNAILGNSIFANAGLGIDLGSDGVTPNDLGDGDAGANNLQNFPELTRVFRSNGGIVIEGTLNSTPRTTFVLQFFSSRDCDPSGFGEGETFLGSASIITEASGNRKFTVTLPVTFPPRYWITATATDPLGNTSEFSRCRR